MTEATHDDSVDLSVIVPVFNEEENLDLLYAKLNETLQGFGRSYEIIFVDDGSTDRSYTILKGIHDQNPNVKIVKFVRNFGQGTAIAAGFRYLHGKTAVTIDADLQSPPEDIPRLVEKLEEGYELVFGARKNRVDPIVRRLGSKVTSWLIGRLTDVELKDGVSSFIALTRDLVNKANLFNEKNRFMIGLLIWLSAGRCSAVDTKHSPRMAGKSKYGFWKLTFLSVSVLANFSTILLRLSTYLGLIIAVIGLSLAAVIIGGIVLFDVAVSGLTLVLASILIFSGVQLICIGFIGEYVGRIYTEVRDGPEYIIEQIVE